MNKYPAVNKNNGRVRINPPLPTYISGGLGGVEGRFCAFLLKALFVPKIKVCLAPGKSREFAFKSVRS